MERKITSGNFITRNLSLIFAGGVYIAALTSPMWGMGWGTMLLPLWAASILLYLLAGLWLYMRPGRSFPKTDINFIVPVVISLQFFAGLLGPDGDWVRPMNYLLVALCAMYYSVWFNFFVAALIFGLDWANVLFSPGGAEATVKLAVHGAYLAVIPLILGRLFHSEYKKKQHVVSAYRRLTEEAGSVSTDHAESESLRSISEEGRAARNVDAASGLRKSLELLLETARSAIPAENAMIFMPDSGGDTVSLRASAADSKLSDNPVAASGQGLIGWVLKEKKPLLVHDKARGLCYLADEKNVRSLIAVPVMDGDRLECIISLDSSAKEAFTEVDRGTLERFGRVALAQITGARALRQVDMTASNFAALHKVSSEMSSSLDLATILERLSGLVREIVPYDYFTLSFVDAEQNASFKLVKGYPEDAKPKGKFPLGNSYIGWIVANSQKLSFNNFDGRTEKLPVFPAPSLKAEFSSFFGVPLVSQDRVQGVMTVALKRSGGISAYQQDMLGIVAGQVAVNIANARLHHTIRLMATTDGLTGLINHRHFQERADERLAAASRYSHPLSVLLFDIDHFKKVNDTYGHPIGDAVLRKVGAILRETVRDVDIAARYGGEEFAVVLEETDEPSALKMAERIRATIEKTRFVFEDKTVPVTISVGCASFPSHCADKKELIERADQSLYWAKENGRNRCCAYSTIANVGV